MVLAIITGTLAGVGAWILKYFIGHMCSFFLGFMRSGEINWYLAALPFIGILAVAAYQRYVIRFDLEHGTARIARVIAGGSYRISPTLCYRPLLANIVTLGFGGSGRPFFSIRSANLACFFRKTSWTVS